MRNIYFLICLLLSAGTIGFLSPYIDINFNTASSGGSSYAVEIAKYKYPVYTDYFEELDDVVEVSGKDGNFHYLSGITNSKEKAESLVAQMKEKGYEEVKLVDLNEEFSREQVVQLIPAEKQDRQKDKKKKISVQSVQRNEANENSLDQLTDLGNTYYYSILLQKSQTPLQAASFLPLKSVKFLETTGEYNYLFGRFEDVSDAQKYLKERILASFQGAQVVVVNKGKLSPVRTVTSAQDRVLTDGGGYNMGRKMRGKEYVDYYYEMPQFKFSKKPLYVIELGPFEDKNVAVETVQKLKDLGFSQARIQEPSLQKETTTTPSMAAAAHFTIQIFASKSEQESSRFTLTGVTSSFDQKDELFRYFYGDYDNYWVCRRELREVRLKGYRDAFIVKL